ncbi:MAG: hypothetical protein LBJ67_01170 [Planctomycetaceae bacterium]|nr:hypothetical protein [Planctomycetaceae bacterium]
MLRRDDTDQEKQTFHHVRFHHPNPRVRERFEDRTRWRQLPKLNKLNPHWVTASLLSKNRRWIFKFNLVNLVEKVCLGQLITQQKTVAK